MFGTMQSLEFLLETLLETFPIPHNSMILFSIAFFKYIFSSKTNFGDIQKLKRIFLCIFTIYLFEISI